MRGFIALLLLVLVISYCSWVSGLVGQWLFSAINRDLALFMGCLTGMRVFHLMWKKLLGGDTPNTPGIQR